MRTVFVALLSVLAMPAFAQGNAQGKLVGTDVAVRTILNFDGTDLISVTALTWYSRQIFLPGS